jgi:hypothetical protein
MGVDVMRSAFNIESKLMVTVLTTEEWNRGPGTPPAVKGLVWYTDGLMTRRRGGGLGRSLWAVFEKEAQYLSRKICYCFPDRDICYLGLRILTL